MNVSVHTWSKQHHRCHYQLICSLFSQPINGLNACFPVRHVMNIMQHKPPEFKTFWGVFMILTFFTCSLSLRSSSSLLCSQPLLYCYIIKWTTCVEIYFAGVPGGPPHWNTHKCLICKCIMCRNSDGSSHTETLYMHTPCRLASCPASRHPAFPFWAVRSHDQWPPWRDIKRSLLHELIMAKIAEGALVFVVLCEERDFRSMT